MKRLSTDYQTFIQSAINAFEHNLSLLHELSQTLNSDIPIPSLNVTIKPSKRLVDYIEKE